MRKIELMHHYFGRGEEQCRDCSHLQSGRYHDRMLRKCDVYGMTHSEASDWNLSFPACGQKNKPYNGGMIIRFVTSKVRADRATEIEGQLEMGGGGNE